MHSRHKTLAHKQLKIFVLFFRFHFTLFLNARTFQFWWDMIYIFCGFGDKSACFFPGQNHITITNICAAWQQGIPQPRDVWPWLLLDDSENFKKSDYFMLLSSGDAFPCVPKEIQGTSLGLEVLLSVHEQEYNSQHPCTFTAYTIYSLLSLELCCFRLLSHFSWIEKFAV
jgi:hypothetical protein